MHMCGGRWMCTYVCVRVVCVCVVSGVGGVSVL